MKTGIRTTEFWITLIMGLTTAVLGVLVVNGLLTKEQSGLISQLIAALVTVVAPFIIGWMTVRYTHARTTLKLQASAAK